MFQIIKSNTKINFAGMFKYAAILSAILVTVSLGLILTKMKYGVDFRGGAELQTKFTEKVDLNKLRSELSSAGFNGITVQSIGELESNEYLIKVPGNEENLNQVTEQVTTALTSHWKDGVEIRKVDIVGPKAGAELRQSGFLAMLWALLAIMVYIGLRFDFKYSPGAIIALFHDVTIVLGVFALTGTEFTLQTVAAILAVIGYSVNDTVIVYDRVREHEAKFVGKKLVEHINNATNETLSRTILTSGTTLFVSIAMLVAGGLAIRDFFMAFTLGVVIGTYSSVFVAAPITLVFDKYRKKSEASTGTVNA
ncbi:protein translocase subunit SecF [Bacteriovorax sp. Seq25_V]|uniref:protein translocase subunit SecF n=1 Tax=Bacteriovorax sp. Seq25_V TaxID=1201288 RepID=UPI000389DABF|nr:protein translocase subunit SecF [Bacteriovorax sp. Seq25_V]EQC44180.1 export membrane protein SecF [Bacteriovorax sp. Seq25_V]